MTFPRKVGIVKISIKGQALAMNINTAIKKLYEGWSISEIQEFKYVYLVIFSKGQKKRPTFLSKKQVLLYAASCTSQKPKTGYSIIKTEDIVSPCLFPEHGYIVLTLNIPFQTKEKFKDWCTSHRMQYDWDKNRKTWRIILWGIDDLVRALVAGAMTKEPWIPKKIYYKNIKSSIIYAALKRVDNMSNNYAA